MSAGAAGTPRIVLCGCTEIGLEISDHLTECGLPLSHIVTISPEEAARAQVAGYERLDAQAAALGVPLYVAERYSLKSPTDLRFFEEQRFDLLVVGGWQRLIPDAVLRTLRVGGIGCHGSSEFLPQGRGRSPINWSLIEGKHRFIVHSFLMKPGADEGDVIAYSIVDLNAWDDCSTVYHKVTIAFKRMLAEQIPRLAAGTAALVPQSGSPTYYPKRTPADGEIDWSRTVFQLHDFIRALARPYPGAFTWVGDRRVQVWRAQPFDTRLVYPGAVAGEVVERFRSGAFVVNCNSGLLLVTECDYPARRGEVFGPAPSDPR